jgi:hypothetical protein
MDEESINGDGIYYGENLGELNGQETVMSSKITPTAAMCSKISPIFMENIMAVRKVGINVQDTQYSKLKKLCPKGNQGEVNASMGVQIQIGRK